MNPLKILAVLILFLFFSACDSDSFDLNVAEKSNRPEKESAFEEESDLGCETAFAKFHKVCLFDGYVFTSKSNSNPENYPSLGFNQGRWGWATNIGRFSGYEEFELYAGAAKNDVSKGTVVGKVTVYRYNYQNAEDCRLKVVYEVFEGYNMSELHIYANDVKPTSIAPGQYGYEVNFDQVETTHVANFEICDSDEDGIWLIAHAVVCQN